MPAEVTVSKKSKPRKPRPKTLHGRTDGHHTPTRKEQLIKLLGRKAGTDVPTMCKMFGWQPHTARAALSALRKDGHHVTRDPACNGRPSRYHVLGTPDQVRPETSVGEVVTDAG